MPRTIPILLLLALPLPALAQKTPPKTPPKTPAKTTAAIAVGTAKGTVTHRGKRLKLKTCVVRCSTGEDGAQRISFLLVGETPTEAQAKRLVAGEKLQDVFGKQAAWASLSLRFHAKAKALKRPALTSISLRGANVNAKETTGFSWSKSGNRKGDLVKRFGKLSKFTATRGKAFKLRVSGKTSKRTKASWSFSVKVELPPAS